MKVFAELMQQKRTKDGEQLPIRETEMASPPPKDTAILLDVVGAAAFLGLTVWQVRGLISSGELCVLCIGRKFYMRRQTLTRWAERAEQRHRA
jgi:hypothetical protein